MLGLATVFKKQFGKSKKQDCITDHLSYLKVYSGASVYGLISKRLKKKNLRDVVLHLKSSQMILKWESYNISTDHLSLGCIKDGISVKHFVSRIVKFKIATQSFVLIIVFNGKYDQELKNGLSYSAFIGELQQAIYNNINNSDLELTGLLGTSGIDRVATEQSAVFVAPQHLLLHCQALT